MPTITTRTIGTLLSLAIGLPLLGVATTTAFVPSPPSHKKLPQHRHHPDVVVLWASKSTEDGYVLAAAALTEQHGLSDRFGRWRYLQRFLDEEEEFPYDMLSILLRRALQEDDPQSEEALTPERLEILREMFPDGAAATTNDGTIPLETVEVLLPDEYEEEDAFKSLWDLTKELHGATAVSMDLRDPAWCERCAVARLLLHHDFLFRGLQS